MSEMRSLLAEEIAPLVGSAGLHALLALVLIFGARHATRAEDPKPDAWVGNAVEVDAVALPEAAPSLPSLASDAASAAHTENDSARDTAAAPIIASPPKSPETTVVAPPPKRHSAPVDKPREKTASSAKKSPASASSDGAAVASSAAPASGAFGGEGLPPGVRSLPSAFTRAIPPATGADSIWQTLPVGPQHPFTIAIEVDADGHISKAEILKEKDGSEPEIQAENLKHRVVALLGGGLFALQNNVGQGRALFRITVTLSTQLMRGAADPAQLVERGFEPPQGASPGRAYFTLASGRHFEAKVQVLSQK